MHVQSNLNYSNLFGTVVIIWVVTSGQESSCDNLENLENCFALLDNNGMFSVLIRIASMRRL